MDEVTGLISTGNDFVDEPARTISGGVLEFSNQIVGPAGLENVTIEVFDSNSGILVITDSGYRR